MAVSADVFLRKTHVGCAAPFVEIMFCSQDVEPMRGIDYFLSVVELQEIHNPCYLCTAPVPCLLCRAELHTQCLLRKSIQAWLK